MRDSNGYLHIATVYKSHTYLSGQQHTKKNSFLNTTHLPPMVSFIWLPLSSSPKIGCLGWLLEAIGSHCPCWICIHLLEIVLILPFGFLGRVSQRFFVISTCSLPDTLQ
jgi:hypothetical protein